MQSHNHTVAPTYNRSTFQDPEDATANVKIAYQAGDIVDLPTGLASEKQRGVLITTELGQVAFMGGYIVQKGWHDPQPQTFTVSEDLVSYPITVGDDFLGYGKVTQVDYRVPPENSDINAPPAAVSDDMENGPFYKIRGIIRHNNLAQEPVFYGKLPPQQEAMFGAGTGYQLCSNTSGPSTMEDALDYLDENKGVHFPDKENIGHRSYSLWHSSNNHGNSQPLESGYSGACAHGDYAFIMAVPMDKQWRKDIFDEGIYSEGDIAEVAINQGATPKDIWVNNESMPGHKSFNAKYIAGVVDSYGKYIPLDSFLKEPSSANKPRTRKGALRWLSRNVLKRS